MSKKLFERLRSSTRYNHFYHFTDIANLPTIREFGLLSKTQLSERGVICPQPGGNAESNEKDAEQGISDYVSLCFTREHPMAYHCRNDRRHTDQHYLFIDPKVILIDGVKVSLSVANSHDAKLLHPDEAIEEMDLEVLYERTNWKDIGVQERLKKARKYELLVPSNVPRDLIVRRRPWNQ